MRIMQAAVLTLLVASAVPSVGFAQIVINTPHRWNHVDRLDHVLPVATVTRTGDSIALVKPQQGDGFVLGAAKLDIKDPDHPMIVYTISNGSETPIPLSRVDVHVVTVNALVDDSAALSVPCNYGGRLTSMMTESQRKSEDTTLRPGAAVTLAMPVGPRCGPDRDGRPRPNVGFLVHLTTVQTSDGTYAHGGAADHALLRSAFEKLRSQSQQ